MCASLQYLTDTEIRCHLALGAVARSLVPRRPLTKDTVLRPEI